MSVDHTMLSAEKWRRKPRLWKKEDTKASYFMRECQSRTEL